MFRFFFRTILQITLQRRKEGPAPTARASGQLLLTTGGWLVTTKPDNSQDWNEELNELKEKCRIELVDIVNGIAGALDVSTNSIMNLTALKAMSEQLPDNEEEMLKIPHVTKANFDKYGRTLLDVTQKYSAQRCGLCYFCSRSLYVGAKIKKKPVSMTLLLF